MPEKKTEAGKIMDSIKSPKNVGGNFTKNKYAVRGGITGAIVGFIVFSYLNKDKFIGTLLGSVAGVFVGSTYFKTEKKVKVKKS